MEETNTNENKEQHVNIKLIAVILGVLLIIVVSCILIINSYFFVSTEDVEYSPKDIDISSKIAGKIIELPINEGIEIKQGEILVKLDSTGYKEKLDIALEKLEKSKKDFSAFSEDINKITSSAKLAKQKINEAKEQLEAANSDYVRYKNAYKDGSVTVKDLNKAIKNLEVAKNNYEAMQKSLKLTDIKLKNAVDKKNSKDEEMKNLINEIEQAKSDLSDTTIISPIDGVIAEVRNKTGDDVTPNIPIFKITSDNFFIANFNKAQYKKIKEGQEAEISIGRFKTKGITDSIDNIDNDNSGLYPVKIIVSGNTRSCKIKGNSKTKVKIKIH